jgi:hypothetical protein
MIRHIVMFNLNAATEESDREGLFGQIRGLSAIESVRSLAIGQVLKPRDEDYRARMSAEFQYALLIDFDDESGLETYQKDPYHIKVAGAIRARASRITVTDFVTFG